MRSHRFQAFQRLLAGRGMVFPESLDGGDLCLLFLLGRPDQLDFMWQFAGFAAEGIHAHQR